MVAVRAPVADSLRPAVTVAPDSVRRDWVLVVGRRADGQVLSTAGISGGRVTSRCADRDVETYVLGAPLPDDGFAGAGLFDLQGRLLGMVVRCDDRLAAIPGREIARLLADTTAAATQVREVYGLTVAPLAGPARAYFGAPVVGDSAGSDSGLLVTTVHRRGAAAAAGLRAGDVIVAVDGRPVAAGADSTFPPAGASGETHQ